MLLYSSRNGLFVKSDGSLYLLDDVSLETVTEHETPTDFLRNLIRERKANPSDHPLDTGDLLPPIARQEVWAAGVTYYRSRDARMEESAEAGGGSFYDRVYSAERPELFYKSAPYRVRGPGEKVRIRSDSKWNVPEPELTLLVSPQGKITGYTIGNDMSSRDIEGENPLYLPQAKVYDGACAIGPCILFSDTPISPDTEIKLNITRGGTSLFTGRTAVSEIKRPLASLVDYLYRETTFPHGAFLMTGTGVVPEDPFTLQSGDTIDITIEPIGVLSNQVE